LIGKKQYKDAIKLTEQSNNDEIFYLRGICFLEINESIKLAVDSFKLCQSKPESLVMLALCEKKQGNKNQCLSYLD